MDNLFKIDKNRIKAKLNPTDNVNGFLGQNSKVKPEEVEETIIEWTSYVIDRLPPRYKRLCFQIDGEWLFGSPAKAGVAKGGETELKTGMKNISNVVLYKNYVGRFALKEPTYILSESEYLVDKENGLITLNTPLNARDRIIATYDHDNLENCQTLKRFVVDLVVSSYAKIFSTDESRLESFYQVEQQVYIDLSRIRDKKTDARINLAFFDNLELVEETINDRRSGVAINNYNSGMR